jgi:hypothetical protein
VEHGREMVHSLDALERNRAFIDIMYEWSNPEHADRMEDYMLRHFGQDAMVAARRVGAGIRMRATLKYRLRPQLVSAPQ